MYLSEPRWVTLEEVAIQRSSEGHMQSSVFGHTPGRKIWWVGNSNRYHQFSAKPADQPISQRQLCSHLSLGLAIDQMDEDEQVDTVLRQVAELIDTSTQGHLRRSRAYGEQLARACTLDDKTVRVVGHGGLLHDIGKIAINKAILHKPGSLTLAERAMIERHPELGAQLIAHLPFADTVAPIILAHHEHWNGGGYPRGLAGEDIPIGARIIAIVDAYDAMTTNRPYRTALHPREAIQILGSGRGTQFDPALTDEFLDLIRLHFDLGL